MAEKEKKVEETDKYLLQLKKDNDIILYTNLKKKFKEQKKIDDGLLK